jgi:hypothetical protein
MLRKLSLLRHNTEYGLKMVRRCDLSHILIASLEIPSRLIDDVFDLFGHCQRE